MCFVNTSAFKKPATAQHDHSNLQISLRVVGSSRKKNTTTIVMAMRMVIPPRSVTTTHLCNNPPRTAVPL